MYFHRLFGLVVSMIHAFQFFVCLYYFLKNQPVFSKAFQVITTTMLCWPCKRGLLCGLKAFSGKLGFMVRLLVRKKYKTIKLALYFL